MHRKRLLCWKAYLPRSSWPTQPTTPIICARPSLPKARSPSSPTTRHGRSNIRSTSISMPSAISWSAASQNSNNSAASQPASKRPPEITVPSSLSQPSSYGCDKCPHHLVAVSPDGIFHRLPRLLRRARKTLEKKKRQRSAILSIKGKAYIAGIYEHPTRHAPDKSTAQLHAEVARGAIEDAGLTKADIDGYFCAGDASGGLWPMVDYLGLKVRHVDSTETGGWSNPLPPGHPAHRPAAAE